MKNIKIKFVGFWPEFDYNDNFIINQLRKYYQVELSNKPEYLFSSCFSKEYLKYGCVRIFYTGENLCPDFNSFDYAIGFEYITFQDRYFRYPNYLLPNDYSKDYDLMMHKNENVNIGIIKEKTDFCSFVVSKGEGYVDGRREKIFKEISRYKKVNSGGRYLNNIGQPDGVLDKLEFQKKHKFALACENSQHSGYTTEKLVQAFAAQTVPIYWGDSDVGKVFNEKAFVNINKYGSIKEAIEVIRKIDMDDNLYLDMLSEPAMLTSRTQEKFNDELGLFLKNIVDQEYKSAYRRDKVGYGQMHCDELRAIEKMKNSRIYRLYMGIKGEK